MQSLFSVFKRPTPSQGSDTSQRRKSSSVSPSAESIPRHLAAAPSASLQHQAAAPNAATSAAEPPKPRSVSTKSLPPPPPRSRQASANAVPTLAHPQQVVDGAQDRLLYVALYALVPSKDGQSTSHHVALHLASSAEEKTVRKYRVKQSKLADGCSCEMEVIETQNEADLLARGLLGYVAEADIARFEAVLREVKVPTASPSTSSSTSETTAKDNPIIVWLTHALSALHTHNLLSTSPTSIPSTTTVPPPPQAQAKPSQRPSLTHRDTDNWNDLPEDFLTADAPRAAGTASQRRKLRDRSIGTPMATPKVSPIPTPRGSGEFKGPPVGTINGSAGEAGAQKSDAAVQELVDGNAIASTAGRKNDAGREDKNADELLGTVARWMERIQQEMPVNGQNGSDESGAHKIPTFDLRTSAVEQML